VDKIGLHARSSGSSVHQCEVRPHFRVEESRPAFRAALNLLNFTRQQLTICGSANKMWFSSLGIVRVKKDPFTEAK